MLSVTSQHALQATVYLARAEDGAFVPARRIAAETNIPQKYLSAVLADLVRAGVLEGAPGRKGGFRLASDARRIPLQDVLEPFEPVLWKRRPCPFGQKTCSDDDPCSGHEPWKKVREALDKFLHGTTVADVAAKSPPRKKLRKAKPRRSSR